MMDKQEREKIRAAMQKGLKKGMKIEDFKRILKEGGYPKNEIDALVKDAKEHASYNKEEVGDVVKSVQKIESKKEIKPAVKRTIARVERVGEKKLEEDRLFKTAVVVLVAMIAIISLVTVSYWYYENDDVDVLTGITTTAPKEPADQHLSMDKALEVLKQIESRYGKSADANIEENIGLIPCDDMGSFKQDLWFFKKIPNKEVYFLTFSTTTRSEDFEECLETPDGMRNVEKNGVSGTITTVDNEDRIRVFHKNIHIYIASEVGAREVFDYITGVLND